MKLNQGICRAQRVKSLIKETHRLKRALILNKNPQRTELQATRP